MASAVRKTEEGQGTPPPRLGILRNNQGDKELLQGECTIGQKRVSLFPGATEAFTFRPKKSEARAVLEKLG